MNSSVSTNTNESDSKPGFGFQLGPVQRELTLVSVLSLAHHQEYRWWWPDSAFFLRRTPVHFAIVAMGILYYVWLASFIAHSFYGDQFVETRWSPYY